VAVEREVRLRALLRERLGHERAVDTLCALCVAELAVTGAGIVLLVRAGALVTVAASDPRMRRVDELQLICGDGPCVEAFSTRGPVLEPDLGSSSAGRWPGFAHGAAEMGVRAVFAFPLQVGAIRLGALDLYRDKTGPLAEGELTDALLLADAATRALLELQDAASGGDGPGPLDEPSLWSPEVHQATGRVMVQRGVGAQEALLRLRARAFSRDVQVTEIAREVLDGTLRFDSPAGDEREES